MTTTESTTSGAGSASPAPGEGATPATPPTSGRLGLVIGWITLFMIGTDLFVVSPILPQIANGLHVDAAAAGYLVTAFSIAYVISAPFLGGVADRLGRRNVLVWGLAVFAVANVASALSPNLTIMLITRVVAGLSAAAVTPSIYALIGQTAPTARRGSWLAIVGSGLLTSLWLSVPVGNAVSTVVGYQVIFYALFVVAAVLALVNRLIWPATVPAPPAPAASGAVATTLTRIRAVSVTALWATAIYVLYTYLGVGLTERGFSGSAIDGVLIAYGVGAVLSSIFGGRFADKWGARKVTTISLVGLAVAEVLIGLLLGAGPILVVLLGIFALLGYATFPGHQARLVGAFPTGTGAVLAWNNSALYVGISLGSIIGSTILATAGFGLIPFVGALVALIGATAAGLWAIPRSKGAEATS